MKLQTLLFLLLSSIFSQLLSQTNVDQENLIGQAIIQFENKIHDFGKCVDGDKVKHSYTFTNIGTSVLKIDTIKSSTTKIKMELSNYSLRPQEKAFLNIIYDSKGMSNEQVEGRIESKRITIVANTSPQNTYLIFRGIVYPETRRKTFLNTIEYNDFLFKKKGSTFSTSKDSVVNAKMSYHENICMLKSPCPIVNGKSND